MMLRDVLLYSDSHSTAKTCVFRSEGPSHWNHDAKLLTIGASQELIREKLKKYWDIDLPEDPVYRDGYQPELLYKPTAQTS